MLFLDLINETIDRLKKDRNDAQVRQRVKTLVNSQYQFVAHAANWKQLEKYQELTVIPTVDTGTANVTNGSRTVTLSSAPPADSAQRYFRLTTGSKAVYRIRYVTGNDIILYSSIVEDSDSDAEYQIRKLFYTLNSNVRVITKLGSHNDYNFNFVQDSYGSIDLPQESPYKEAGYDEYTGTYTAGTISLTKDSNIVTGSGTSFLGNVTEGASIEFESKKITVLRVETNTRIISLNYSGDAYSGTYTAREDTPRQIEFLFTIPGTGSRQIIPVNYISKVYPMVNEDFDRTELDDTFREVILNFTEARYQSDANNPNANNNIFLSRASVYLQDLIAKKDLIDSPFQQFAPMIPNISGRG